MGTRLVWRATGSLGKYWETNVEGLEKRRAKDRMGRTRVEGDEEKGKKTCSMRLRLVKGRKALGIWLIVTDA